MVTLQIKTTCLYQNDVNTGPDNVTNINICRAAQNAQILHTYLRKAYGPAYVVAGNY